MANIRQPYFGRTELEWQELEAVGWDLLLNCTARLTTYSELNSNLARITEQPAWSFSNPAHRNAMAHLLGSLSDRSFVESATKGREPVMISALCKFMHENDAGDGFYGKAVELKLITENLYKNKQARFEWWAAHVGRVQAWLAER